MRGLWQEKYHLINVIISNTIIYMKLKSNLKTVRLTTEEERRIALFITEHPYIKEFSTLVRAAIWEFLQRYSPSIPPPSTPSFLWEYNLNHGEIVEILHGPQKKRLWLVAKILEQAKWDEIWEYLDLNMIEKDLPRLRLAPRTRRHWEEAINLWKKKTV